MTHDAYVRISPHRHRTRRRVTRAHIAGHMGVWRHTRHASLAHRRLVVLRAASSQTERRPARLDVSFPHSKPHPVVRKVEWRANLGG